MTQEQYERLRRSMMCALGFAVKDATHSPGTTPGEWERAAIRALEIQRCLGVILEDHELSVEEIKAYEVVAFLKLHIAEKYNSQRGEN